MMEPGFLPATKLAALVRRGKIGCVELLDHFIARVERLDSRLNAVVVRDFERARKAARAALDYDDLIHFTEALLRRNGISPWILYKLDKGIDHILVDEAQDTSRAQWNIVEALTAEFFAGSGARAPPDHEGDAGQVPRAAGDRGLRARGHGEGHGVWPA